MDSIENIQIKPPLVLWYESTHKVSQLADILRNPILREAIELIKYESRPVFVADQVIKTTIHSTQGNSQEFLPVVTEDLERTRSHRLARMEGVYSALESLDALAKIPQSKPAQENLKPWKYKTKEELAQEEQLKKTQTPEDPKI